MVRARGTYLARARVNRAVIVSYAMDALKHDADSKMIERNIDVLNKRVKRDRMVAQHMNDLIELEDKRVISTRAELNALTAAIPYAEKLLDALKVPDDVEKEP
jgi:hypothetical protein